MNTNGRTPLDGSNGTDEQLDVLLREWHDQNRDRAARGRDRLVEALRSADARTPAPSPASTRPAPPRTITTVLQTLVAHKYLRAAASVVVIAGLVALLLPQTARVAEGAVIQVPDGGRLDAFDGDRLVGPCPLAHTDVDVDISGRFTRVTLQQRYTNPYPNKIEAVYTFPLSHRAAVDRMTMTVGDRVVTGAVKERAEARRIYDAAKQQGYLASLLEQERPNIFTQSIANIEPGAEVLIEISYVEVLESADGTWSFDFPMVVGPRYIPGRSTASRALVPAELEPCQGVVLLGPGRLEIGQPGVPDQASAPGMLHPGQLQALLDAAQPIDPPGEAWLGRGEHIQMPAVWSPFVVTYIDGAREAGVVYVDGIGHVNGRWFFTEPRFAKDQGTGYAANTDRVPDASRVTPMPVRPPNRAGHDIDVSVSIDTGGPGIVDWKSALHDVEIVERVDDEAGHPRRLELALANRNEIPNRDFVLSWRLEDDTVQPAHFVHRGDHGGFFTFMLEPPKRVDDDRVVPRELVFVLDRSGSMKGYPIAKARDVMTRAIDAMRGGDTFNVITFAAETSALWPAPRPATAENRAEARTFVERHEADGSTEMLEAIEAALAPTPDAARPDRPLAPDALANLPADGRAVHVRVGYESVQAGGGAGGDGNSLAVREDLALALRMHVELPPVFSPIGVEVDLSGTWSTVDGRRVLVVKEARLVDRDEPVEPMRVVMFLTDGYVGNEAEIISAVRANARTTRVFSFGIGESLNRHLLDEMARAGHGAVEYVQLEADADAAVERFCRRFRTPVLTGIELEFGDGLAITDTIPPLDSVADLFDHAPIIIHGRYAEPGSGTLTIRGRTGAGPWEQTIDVELPEHAPEHDVVATIWARAKVGELTKTDARDDIIALGEQFQIMTKYTSFVAVEKSRMTVEGRPMLVAVPIELSQGVSWEGNFGGQGQPPNVEQVARGLVEQVRFRNTNGLQSYGLVVHPPTPTTATLTDDRDVMLVTAKNPTLATLPDAIQARIVVADTNGGVSGDTIAAGYVMHSGLEQEGAVALGEQLGAQFWEVGAQESTERLSRLAITRSYEPNFKGGEGDSFGAIRHLDTKFGEIKVDLPAEAYALALEQVYKQGDVDQAGLIADFLVAEKPDFELGRELNETLRDRALAEGERADRITGLADQARRKALADGARARRMARLRQVLDQRLWPLVLESTAVRGLFTARGPVLVSVLTADESDATIAALEAAGLDIQDRRGRHVVGTIAPGRLVDLALAVPVLRIEPPK